MVRKEAPKNSSSDVITPQHCNKQAHLSLYRDHPPHKVSLVWFRYKWMRCSFQLKLCVSITMTEFQTIGIYMCMYLRKSVQISERGLYTQASQIAVSAGRTVASTQPGNEAREAITAIMSSWQILTPLLFSLLLCKLQHSTIHAYYQQELMSGEAELMSRRS